MHPNSGQASMAYRKAAANVHPGIALVRIYDELILAIRQAIRAKEDKNHELAFTKIMRAALILRGLAGGLDLERGGEVSERLLQVYKSYILNLHLSYGKEDVVRRYNKLLEGLVELRDAWAFVAGERLRNPS